MPTALPSLQADEALENLKHRKELEIEAEAE
jgi:hypothetical protein